jgi:hypothetical protein
VSEYWRNPDGSIDYQDYLSSRDWGRWRESYWKRHPDGVCVRCGMTLSEHRLEYGQRLHLHHLSYRNIGQEADDDVEAICKSCHDDEHSGESNRETLMETLSDPGSQSSDYRRILASDSTIAYLREFDELEEDLTPGEYWQWALDKIDQARKPIVGANDSESWKALARLQFIEEFARACLELDGAPPK